MDHNQDFSHLHGMSGSNKDYEESAKAGKRKCEEKGEHLLTSKKDFCMRCGQRFK